MNTFSMCPLPLSCSNMQAKLNIECNVKMAHLNMKYFDPNDGKLLM